MPALINDGVFGINGRVIRGTKRGRSELPILSRGKRQRQMPRALARGKGGALRRSGYRGVGLGKRSAGNRAPLPVGEIKNIDFGINATALAAPTDCSGMELNPNASTPLNGVVQGTSGVTRIERSIRQHFLSIKGTIVVTAQVGQTAADTAPECFLAVVLDTQNNALASASEDMYTNPVANAGLATQPYKKLTSGKRFVTLKRLKFRLPQPVMAWNGTTVEQGGFHKDFEFNIPLKGRKLTFADNVNTNAGINSGVINLFGCVNNNSMAPKVMYNSRLYFSDA